MTFPRSFRQSRLTSIGRRLRYLGSRLTGSRLQKSQQVAIVEINGVRYKRIITRDSYLAAAIERALETFGRSERLPQLVIRYEHEVWVRYIDGSIPDVPDSDLARDLAAFYAHVHARAATAVDARDSVWVARLERDLEFLATVGVLSPALDTAVRARVPEMTPERLWIGFDYNDPVIKNFVRDSDGRLCGIDVEALVENQLIGLGVAKALIRWLEPYRAEFFAAYAETGAPDFASYLAFVELSQLAAYTKLMFVERKWSNIDPARFERFA